MRRYRVIAVLGAALVLAGCGGSAEPGDSQPSKLAGPAEFARAVKEPARVTINVHVPNEGSIAGTDLWIPFDGIATRGGELPAPGTPLALYCRSGRMSAVAARTLAGLGYTDVVELEGGMEAWVASGRKLQPSASP